MKIGIDARVLMDKHYSGVSEYLANLLSNMLEKDKENDYRLFYNSFKKPSDKLNAWEKENSKLKGTRYPNKFFNYCLQKIFSYPKLDKFLGETDLYFAPHFNFISLSEGAQFVITVHDISFLRYPEFFSRRKNFWHNALRIKKTLNRANKIVAVSENTKKDLIEVLNIPEEKIVVIHSGCNYSSPNISKDNEVEEFLKSRGIKRRFILFIGNIEPRKNIINLIEAYNLLRKDSEELKEVQLVIAGAPGWKHKKIFSAWKDSPYKDDIKFLGYVEKKEKEYLYQRASLFAYPSFYEGFGFPPLEAMSYKVPVVSSNVSSLPEILGNSAILVDPYQSGEIKDAMAMLLTDRELRSSLIERGIEKAKEYSWEKTAHKYLELFKELNNENRS